MAFYRLNDEEDSDDEDSPTVEKVHLTSFVQLPPELYKQLVDRSLSIAQRLKARSQKLHTMLADHVDFEDNPENMEAAYWRTACVEQMAFFEMQIGNIHDFLQQLMDKSNDWRK